MPGVKVVEEEKVPETVDVQKTMESMIEQDGATLIFPTSFGYFDPHILQVAEKYPNVRFLHCGGLWTEGKHPKNVGSYFGYIDECQYLSGIVAGHTTKIEEARLRRRQADSAGAAQHQRLHAGRAHRRSERSPCSVIFTGDWSMPVKEAEATNSLIDQGVRRAHLPRRQPEGRRRDRREARHLSCCGYHASQAALAPKGYLTGAEWNWAKVYTTDVKAAQAGKPHAQLPARRPEGRLRQDVALRPGRDRRRRSKKADAVKAKMVDGQLRHLQGAAQGQQGHGRHPGRQGATSRPTSSSRR